MQLSGKSASDFHHFGVCDSVVFLFLLPLEATNFKETLPCVQKHFKLLASIQQKQNTGKSNLFVFFPLLMLDHVGPCVGARCAVVVLTAGQDVGLSG